MMNTTSLVFFGVLSQWAEKRLLDLVSGTAFLDFSNPMGPKSSSDFFSKFYLTPFTSKISGIR